MGAGAILVLAAALSATSCDAGALLARLAHGVCAVEAADPGGVRARRCDALQAASPTATANGPIIDAAVDDGTSIWMAVSEHGACGVRPRGLVRADRATGRTQVFRGTDAGPCGFLVHDLLLRDDTLWVATDLGLSRLRLSPDDWDEWTHYAVSADGALEETACGALLATVADAARTPGGEELGRWLAEFRPRFARRMRRGMRPASAAGQEAR